MEELYTLSMTPAKRPTTMDDVPVNVIHNIMRYLPYKDAAKLMFLSRSLKSYWLSFPTLSFSFQSTAWVRDNERNYNKFFKNVEETLQIRGPHIKGFLQSLSLFHNGIGKDNSNAYQKLLVMLLYYALEKEVRVIELQNLECVFHEFSRCEIVDVHCDSFLPLFSSQYLTILKLTGINFSPVADIFMNCPKLEELSIKHCDGFQAIKVSSSSSSLKKVEVTCCKNLSGIQIGDGRSLQSFVFEGFYEHQKYTVDILSCPTQLRVLKLIKAATMTDEWLNAIIQGSSYLEELEISECSLLRKMEFESQSLKMFSLLNCMNMKEVIASVPNLQEFNYGACELVHKLLILGSPTQIRVLKLFKATAITDKWLNWIIRGSSYLEELEISECSFLRYMEFKNKSLKKFSLFRCINLKEVISDVPNLYEFNYDGSLFVSSMFIVASRCNGNISLPSMIPYDVMKDFFRFFSHFKQLTLSFTSYENLIIPMDNCPQSPAFYGNGMLDIILKVQLYDPVPSDGTLTQVLESLLCLFSKPRTITFSSQLTEKRSTLKFEYGGEVRSKIVKVGDCCNDVPMKCWRHYEREIKFEGFDEYVRGRLEKFFNDIA